MGIFADLSGPLIRAIPIRVDLFNQLNPRFRLFARTLPIVWGKTRNICIFNKCPDDGFSAFKGCARNNALGIWSTDYYSEKAVQYDLNGNITGLKRYTNEEASAGLIDDLDYDYGAGGNQLMLVTDNGTALIGHKGFNDGNTSGDDYAYDANGNLTVDKNKDMTIAYNHLNLAEKITFADDSYIQYTYDAGGTNCRNPTMMRIMNWCWRRTTRTSLFTWMILPP